MNANDVTIIGVKEVTYGTTPADDPGWLTARFTSENISATPVINASNEIRSDRMRPDQFKTSIDVNGGFNFEMHKSSLIDMILECAMNKAWATDVLKIGKEDHSMSLEKNYSALSANHYLLFEGMRVGNLDFSMAHGEPVNGVVGFMGSDVTPGSTSAVGVGSVADPSANRVMNGVGDLSVLKIGGTAFSGCISALDLSINNNLRPQKCLGQDYPQNQLLGTCDVTGSVEAYLTDTTVQWYTDQVIGQTDFELEFTIGDGTNTYNFLLPKLRLSGNSPGAEGIDTDVLIRVDFTALYDVTEDTSLKITRA